MMRILTVGTCATVAALLLSSDASACGRRSARSATTYYAGSSYGSTAPGYGYAPGYGTAPGYGAYAPGYGTAPGYGYGGNPGYDFGRPGYNPGGLGGPASGLGVRPGVGVGGFGVRR